MIVATSMGLGYGTQASMLGLGLGAASEVAQSYGYDINVLGKGIGFATGLG